MKIVIIDNYDSFTFNLYQMLAEVSMKASAETRVEARAEVGVGVGRKMGTEADTHEVSVFRNDEINLPELKALAPNRIVLSPGPGHPARESDFGVCKDIIKNAQALACPILGICLGHQGIVQHLGGKVIGAPQIVHGKSSEIKITAESPIFNGLAEQFLAMRYHSLIASDEIFPVELNVIAREVQHNLIMAVQHSKYPLYGLQFHPESIGTPLGRQILSNFIEKC